MEKFLLKIREHMIKHVQCRLCSKIHKVLKILNKYVPISDRELLISQTCNDCWNKIFPK